MDSPAPPADTAHVPGATYRFKMEDVDRMVDAGIIDAELRLELWDGNILPMAPFRVPGSNAHTNLLKRLQKLCPPNIELRSEKPIDLADRYFGLEPDIALVDRKRELRDHQHPGPRDIALLIEISDTTNSYDLAKVPKYAAAEIRELWIVDVPAKSVTLYRKPRNGHYQAISEPHTGNDRLTVEAFPNMTFAVSDIFT